MQPGRELMKEKTLTQTTPFQCSPRKDWSLLTVRASYTLGLTQQRPSLGLGTPHRRLSKPVAISQGIILSGHCVPAVNIGAMSSLVMAFPFERVLVQKWWIGEFLYWSYERTGFTLGSLTNHSHMVRVMLSAPKTWPFLVFQSLGSISFIRAWSVRDYRSWNLIVLRVL